MDSDGWKIKGVGTGGTMAVEDSSGRVLFTFWVPLDDSEDTSPIYLAVAKAVACVNACAGLDITKVKALLDAVRAESKAYLDHKVSSAEHDASLENTDRALADLVRSLEPSTQAVTDTGTSVPQAKGD